MSRALGHSIVLLLVLLANGADSFFPPWPMKPRCSFRPVQLKLKPDNADRFRGSCSIIAWRQDTCKGSKLACCRNVVGEFLCVRPEGVEKRRQDIFNRIANPFDFYTPGLLQIFGEEGQMDKSVNDKECPTLSSALDCIYDQSTGPCKTQEDCPTNSVCCNDPCADGGSGIRLCYPKPSKPKSGPVIGNQDQTQPKQSELPAEVEQSGVSENVKKPIDEVITEPKNEVVDPPKPAETPKQVDSAKVPPKDIEEKTSGQKSPPKPDDIKNNEPSPVDDEQCPKADFKCDESTGKCAVGCPAYTSEVTECKTTADCAENRVCCNDPCPKSKLRLCFLKKKNGGIVLSANAKVSPPKELIEKSQPKKKDKKDNGSDRKVVCPTGDFTSCIAWMPVPGKTGTGTCDEHSKCSKDRRCCKITECGDNIKHCVPFFDCKLLEPGCPIPKHGAVSEPKKCGDGDVCGNDEICCKLDMIGTRGCVKPQPVTSCSNQ